MSDIRFNNWKHQSGTGGVVQDAAGKVGIGSTQPSSMLDVGGEGKFTGVVTATSLTVNGDVTLGNTLASDEVTFNSKVNTNLLPSTNGNKDLGSSGNRWGEVHAATFHGSGANLTGLPVSSEFNFGSTGITTTKNLGINTSTVDNYETVGAANSFRGIYIGDGSLIFNARLDNPNGYYIGTGRNALNAGPITLGSTMTLDGAWVIV